jgi:uncharacterized protein with PIN domain
MHDKRLRNLIEALVSSEDDPGELHKCPECGGRLHLVVTEHTRADGQSAIGVQAWCEDCKAAVAMDGPGPIPTWAKTRSDSS